MVPATPRLNFKSQNEKKENSFLSYTGTHGLNYSGLPRIIFAYLEK